MSSEEAVAKPEKYLVWRFLKAIPGAEEAYRDLIQRIKNENVIKGRDSLFYEAWRLFRWENQRLVYSPEERKVFFEADWEAKVTGASADAATPVTVSPPRIAARVSAKAASSAESVESTPEEQAEKARLAVEDPDAVDLDLTGVYERDWTKDFDLISNERYRDELRDLIAKNAKTDFDRDFEWVYQQFANPLVTPRFAPSVAAWGLLAICRKAPAKYFDKVVPHFQVQGREQAAEKRKNADAMKSQMRLIDTLCKELASEVEETVMELVKTVPDQLVRVLESMGWKVVRPVHAT